MTINDLEFFLVEIPCDGLDQPVRSVLVRLTTDSGLEGWGEAQMGWRAGELAARRDLLLPALAGRCIFDIEELLLEEALADARLRSAVEMAFWDLVGRTVGQPLAHLFGGGFRKRIPLAIRLAGKSGDEMAQVARELADRGFHSQIIPSTGRWEQDVAALAALAPVADRIELQLDAAARFDPDGARDLCLELESTPVQLVVDPLAASPLDEIAALRRQTSVPLAVRRGVTRPADVLALLRCSAAQNLVVDLQLVGGIVWARQCAAVAQAGELSASLGGGPSLGVGVAAMLQLAASTPAFSRCNECAYHGLEDDLLAQPLELSDGMITVPQGPGLGIEIDRAKVERYQIS